jgi:hypothetical protein
MLNFDKFPTEHRPPKTPEDLNRPRDLLARHLFRNESMMDFLIIRLGADQKNNPVLPKKGSAPKQSLDEISRGLPFAYSLYTDVNQVL